MTNISNLSRRHFMKSAGVTALVGTLGGGHAQAASSLKVAQTGPFDFDTPYNRVGTNCSRWDSPAKRYPAGQFKYGMGVATMDFEAPPCITEALEERCKHHTWGYMSSTDSLRDEVLKWSAERHGLELDPKSVVLANGVYPGVIAALRTFAPPASKVLMLTPIYDGFFYHCRHTGVIPSQSPMKQINGRFEIDWEDLESRMTPDTHAMIVCNPQNPTGNVWTQEELLRIGRLCLEHKIVVLSDEIHSDIVRPGHTYIPFASLPDEAVVNNSVTFNALSKTFNMAGMKTAFLYSKNPTLLGRVVQNHRGDLNTLGVTATEAAYKEGGPWVDQLLPYLDGNHSFVESYVRDNMPLVGNNRSEGTYMTWLDFSKAMEAIGAKKAAMDKGYSSPEHYFQDWLVEHSGVYLNPGSNYGPGGDGHMRMNLGSSRLVVKEAFDSMAAALRKV